MKAIGILAGAAALATATSLASAQSPAAPAASAAQVNGRNTVADVRRILAANYVLADVRPKLDRALADGLAAGRYDVADPAILAERINADLGAVAHDKHLGIHYDPAEQARLAAQPRAREPTTHRRALTKFATRPSSTTASSR